MGRAARRKRDVLEGRPAPLSPSTQPWWSVYARVYMWLANIQREAGNPAEPFPLVSALQQAHVFFVEPVQASAAPVPDTFSTDRLPFPVVLLATGEDSGDAAAPPYATLIQDWRYPPPFKTAPRTTPDPEAGLTLLPLYARRRGGFSGPGMCHLDAATGQLSVANFRAAVEDGGAIRPEHFKPQGAGLVVMKGAATALAALELLRSVNVDVEGRPLAPRGHAAAGVPCHEVVIRQHRARRPSTTESTPVDWSHRWEVRGHYKHFTRGRIFDANPDRRVEHDGQACVRVWCPPFVKGPDDKPLIPKARRTAAGPYS